MAALLLAAFARRIDNDPRRLWVAAVFKLFPAGLLLLFADEKLLHCKAI